MLQQILNIKGIQTLTRSEKSKLKGGYSSKAQCEFQCDTVCREVYCGWSGCGTTWACLPSDEN